MFAGELLDQEVLRAVRVLVLVHHHVAEARRVPAPHGFRLVEQLDRLEQQVVEVQRVALAQHLRVARVDVGHLLVADVPACTDRLRALHAVFRLADAGQRHPGRQQFLVDPQLLEDLLHRRLLIGGVVDDEVPREADGRRLAPEEARAEGMKGRDPQPAAVHLEQGRDALPHLLGGLVREGDREDLVEVGEPTTNQVGDPVGGHAGFPRSGSRQDQQRALGLEHGVLLLRVEVGDEGAVERGRRGAILSWRAGGWGHYWVGQLIGTRAVPDRGVSARRPETTTGTSLSRDVPVATTR